LPEIGHFSAGVGKASQGPNTRTSYPSYTLLPCRLGQKLRFGLGHPTLHSQPSVPGLEAEGEGPELCGAKLGTPTRPGSAYQDTR